MTCYETVVCGIRDGRIQRRLLAELGLTFKKSVISNKKYQQLWKGHGPFIQPTDIKLMTYTGKKLEVKGNICVQVQYQGQRKTLPLLIVGGEGLTLLGRNWLQHIKLDWRALNSISVEPTSHNVQSVIRKHPGVFKQGGFRAHAGSHS